MIHERQGEKTAMNETIHKLQKQKPTQAQKKAELKQKVNCLESSLYLRVKLKSFHLSFLFPNIV